MKLDFKTIKKFTGDGRYVVDVDVESVKYHIERYQEKHGLQLNPDFQRGHVWSEEQQISFMEFLFRGGVIPPIRFNHNNWMAFKPTGNEMVCVDGLQRITAILKFMDNKLPIFGGYLKDDIEGIHYSDYYVRFSVNNIKNRSEVLTWYVELNEGGTPHSKEEIERVKKLIDGNN